MTGIVDFSYEKVLEGLRHDDIFVRSGILAYLDSSNRHCGTDTSHVALDAIEKHGWSDAFEFTHQVGCLPLDGDVVDRLFDYVSRNDDPQQDEVRERLKVNHCLTWFSNAPAEVCADAIERACLLFGDDEKRESDLLMIKFRIDLLEKNEDECREMLDENVNEAAGGDEFPLEIIDRIEMIAERLANLKVIDHPWIEEWRRGAPREENHMVDTVGLLLATAAKVPVSVAHCVDLLILDQDYLLNDITEQALAETATEAMMMEIADLYLSHHIDQRLYLSGVFERVRYPGIFPVLLDLAFAEEDWSIAARFGTALAYYGTEEGMVAAHTIYQEDPGMGDNLEIARVLYAFRILEGKNSTEWKQLRAIFEEDLIIIKNPSFAASVEQFEFYPEYDPLFAPDPGEWLEMDEGERQLMVEAYVSEYEGGIEGASLHASIHVLVENQIALGAFESPTGPAMERLIEKGLSRHEAIHAIGSILAEQFFGMMKHRGEFDPNQYEKELAKLDFSEWIGSAPLSENDGDDLPNFELPNFSQLESSIPPVETFQRESPKVGRNDPCPCGSGKKYKKCCVKFAN